MSKLHLGCGSVYLPGYINLEYQKKFMGNSFKVDSIGSGMSLPFKNSSLDEIISYHVIEHLPRPAGENSSEKWRLNVTDFLKECFRTLKIGGKLIIECPDIKGIFEEIVKNNNWSMIDHVYGLDRYEGDTHQWGYTKESIKSLLKSSGFDNIKISDGTDYHILNEPSMRVEALKINLKRINIEPTPACNLACKFCSRIDKIRPNKAMDLGLYRSILHQLFTLGLNDIEIRFFLSGEPLAAGKSLLQMLKLADRLGFKNTLIHTNGTLLDKYGDEILKAGLGKLSISIDGADKETYESIRINGNFESVINNARQFIKKAKNTKTKTIIQSIINFNEGKIYFEERIKELLPGADEYYVRHPHNWNTSDEITGFSTGKQKTRSCFPAENISIYSDGRVPVCCADLNGDFILADANKEPLIDIWVQKLGQIRDRMKNLEPIPELCDNCERYGKAAGSIASSASAMQKQNSDFEIDLSKAEKLIEEGELAAAKELLENLKNNYGNINVLIDLSVVNIMLKNYDEAAVILNQALFLEPENEIVRENLAYLNEMVNQH